MGRTRPYISFHSHPQTCTSTDLLLMFFDSQLFLFFDFHSDCSRSSISPVFRKGFSIIITCIVLFSSAGTVFSSFALCLDSFEGFRVLIADPRFASNFTSSSTAIAWLLCKGMVDSLSSDRKWFSAETFV